MVKVAVVGCGRIGARRAREAATHPQTRLELVADPIASRRQEIARQFDCQAVDNWREALTHPGIDVFIVSTPNGYSAEIACAALAADKHVLVEKPPGRNLAEATGLAEAARASGRVLKVGFNHRYHPALSRAHQLLRDGAIGGLINLRARYGHGGRPGYENEWRGSLELAGGGELTDQGVHVADLLNWFAGLPCEAFAWLQTAVWPLQPLEDNAFALVRFASGAIASIHTSWTQWKNLFSFELFGSDGAIVVDGLGGSYGVERLTVVRRRPQGGVPKSCCESFDGPDLSWELEWKDFVAALTEGRPYLGTAADGVRAMELIDAMYRSARTGGPIELTTSADA